MHSLKVQQWSNIDDANSLGTVDQQSYGIFSANSWTQFVLQVAQFQTGNILWVKRKNVFKIISRSRIPYTIRTNSSGSISCSTCFRNVTLFGVVRYIFCDSMTHVSITMSGRSENRRMHSLKPDDRSVVFNCFSTDMPMNSGNELSPRINLSQRWMILYSGKTSAIRDIVLMIDDWLICDVTYVKTL